MIRAPQVSYDDGDARVYSDILAKTFILLPDEQQHLQQGSSATSK